MRCSGFALDVAGAPRGARIEPAQTPTSSPPSPRSLPLGGGTAWAAHHYLVTSPSQIKPSALKSLKGKRGTTGTTGTTGCTGPIGTAGTTGSSGCHRAHRAAPDHASTWRKLDRHLRRRRNRAHDLGGQRDPSISFPFPLVAPAL